MSLGGPAPFFCAGFKLLPHPFVLSLLRTLFAFLCFCPTMFGFFDARGSCGHSKCGCKACKLWFGRHRADGPKLLRESRWILLSLITSRRNQLRLWRGGEPVNSGGSICSSHGNWQQRKGLRLRAVSLKGSAAS